MAGVSDASAENEVVALLVDYLEYKVADVKEIQMDNRSAGWWEVGKVALKVGLTEILTVKLWESLKDAYLDSFAVVTMEIVMAY